MFKIFIHIAVLLSLLFASGSGNFALKVGVEFISIRLLNLSGGTYSSYTTTVLDPGDTAVCDSASGMWIDNQSNIPVGLVAWAYDDTVFVGTDSLLWKLEAFSGVDTCAIGIATYDAPSNPNIADVHWLGINMSIIESGLIPGEDCYGYIFFIAPTDTVKYCEPQHRIKMVIGVFPE